MIKVGLEKGGRGLPILSRAELDAIVGEAHDRDLLVTAHVSHVDEARMALEAGVDDLAHMPCFGDDPELMADLADAEVEIVGTLDIIDELASAPCSITPRRSSGRRHAALRLGLRQSGHGPPASTSKSEPMVRAGLSTREALTNATCALPSSSASTGSARCRKAQPAARRGRRRPLRRSRAAGRPSSSAAPVVEDG